MASTKDTIINVLCVIFAVTSIVGNSLVCHVIIQAKSMKTAMNYLLLNLALLDIITGILAIFNVVIHDRFEVFRTSMVLEQIFNKSTIAAEVVCKVEVSFWIGSALTPMFLMVMAYERYMAVVHPLSRRAGGVTKARLKWILTICWLWGIAILGCDVLTITYQDGVCDVIKSVWFNIQIYGIILLSLHFVIPSLVIFVLYFRVIKALKTTEVLGVQAAVQRARNTAKRKVVFVIVSVTLILYVCSGIPHVLYFLFEQFGLDLWFAGEHVSILLFTINSVSSPFIYFTFIKSFRDKLVNLICRSAIRRPRQNLIIINTTSLQPNTSNYEGNYHDNRSLENEPKLLHLCN